MEELGLPSLTEEQVEQLCKTAEQAARKHVLARVPSKKIETLNVTVEAEHAKPLQLAVDIEIRLSPTIKGIDVQKLCDTAVKQAFAKAENYLRELKCHSRK